MQVQVSVRGLGYYILWKQTSLLYDLGHFSQSTLGFELDVSVGYCPTRTVVLTCPRSRGANYFCQQNSCSGLDTFIPSDVIPAASGELQAHVKRERHDI